MHVCFLVKRISLKEPLIDEFGDGFRVVFFRKTIRANQKEDNGDATGIRTGRKAINEDPEKCSESGKKENPAIRQSGNPQLADQESLIVKYVHENDECTASAIAGLLDVTGRRARGILGNLVKKEVLKKVGNARNTVYRAGGNFPYGK